MRNDCKYSTWDFRSPNWSFKRLAWQGFSQDWSRRQVTWFRWVGWVVHSMLCRVKLRLRVWEECGFLAYAPFATPEYVIAHQTPVERQKKQRSVDSSWLILAWTLSPFFFRDEIGSRAKGSLVTQQPGFHKVLCVKIPATLDRGFPRRAVVLCLLCFISSKFLECRQYEWMNNSKCCLN